MAVVARTTRKFLSRFVHSATQASYIEKQIVDFRTTENDPANHNTDHECRFYTIHAEVKKQLFQHGGFPTSFAKQAQTFAESCIMVREPAIEILRYLKTADYSRPAVRYVLYGQLGCGKSITLAHILHYAHNSGFLLLHVPWVSNWMRRCKEVSNSTTKEGFVDLPLDAASWLVHFKSQNAGLLKQLDLKVSKEYVWSKRESTSEGASLLELVDLGINRMKYASDCVVAIISEIKAHSTQGRCKTLVGIDGFNAFFHPKTRIVTEDKIKVSPSKISFTEAFLDITKYDWCNGAIIVTVDRNAVHEDRQASDYPLYQLGKDGFQHLDPFVPIEVKPYSNKEFESCLAYYIDRHWLQSPKGKTEEGFKELSFLSAHNPYKLMQICAPL